MLYICKASRLANVILIYIDFASSPLYILDASAHTMYYTHVLDGTCQNKISGYTIGRMIVYKNNMFAEKRVLITMRPIVNAIIFN